MKKGRYFILCYDGKNKYVNEIDGYIYTEPTSGIQYGVYYNRDFKEWSVTHLATGLYVNAYGYPLTTKTEMQKYLAGASETIERVAKKNKETQKLFEQLVKEYNDDKENSNN